MEDTTLLAILKVGFMLLFVAIVCYVGTLPIRNPAFKTNKFLKSMGTTFAGALFINVSVLHILPDSADVLQKEMQNADDPDAPVFPLANLLLVIGFLITIFFTKIIASHSHDDSQHEGHSHSHGSDDENKIDTVENTKDQKNQDQSLNGSLIRSGKKKTERGKQNDAYFLTLAMYFHTLFEGIAIGVQNTVGGFLSTAVAIAFHKWADALSMGIHYRNKDIKKNVANGLIIGQAILNVVAIGIGWAITSFGQTAEAVFLAISAGTFLAISTMQMLGKQLNNDLFKIHKFVILLLSTGIICGVWFVENSIFE